MKAVLFLVLALIILSLACGGSSAPHTVTYQVDGSKGVKTSLTYKNAGGDTQQEEITLPWSKEFTMKGGDFAYISAQIKSDNGKITCAILVDGQPFKQAESSGPYVIASCSDKIPR